MKHQNHNPESALDQAVKAMRVDQPSQETVSAAGERVWANLSEHAAAPAFETIRGCADVKALLPQYRAGELAASRELLIDAHLRECASCRRENESSSTPKIAPWTHELERPQGNYLRWAVAAVALIALSFGGYFLREAVISGPAGMRASVVSFEGSLFKVGTADDTALRPGDEIKEGEMVRTGGGSRAMLRLRDGSMVEMNERSQFGVAMSRKDTTINLDRGKIIVQAAKRKAGHLYVATRDVKVAVTGTVFSVNSGIKGARVSVIEGEVHVAADGVNSVLHSGDQVSTEAAGPVPVKQEIAWSQNADQHLALLAEFAHLQNKLAAVQLPGLRYQSKLLPLLSPDTTLYAAIPNLGDAVQQGNQLFQQELQESPILKQWWDHVQSGKGSAEYSRLIEYIHDLSQYVGDEIVFSVALDGREASPLAIAQVQRPGLKQFIEQEAAKESQGTHIHVFDQSGIGSAKAQPKHDQLLVLVGPDFVAASVDLGALQRFNSALQQGSGGFAGSGFGQRMSAAYQQGAGFLFGANLQVMAAHHAANHPGAQHNEHFQQTGFADAEYLVAERKDISGQVLNQAQLTFNGPRRGLASWLAAPAPIGGLDYISKDASAAAALVSKSPSQMLDDILNIAGEHAQADMTKGESELNIRFREDLADTLGGEVTLALDGPILPTPSWKMVLEVYNPGRLQSTIQQLLTDLNNHVKDPSRRVSISQESSGGVTFYTIHFVDSSKPAEVNYAFVDGYMIVAPSRALVMNSIAIHQNGNSLARSTGFRSLLPQDQHTDVSAVLYQNLAPVVGPVMQQLTPQQLSSLQQLAAESKPSVVCAYGDRDAIRVASNSRFFGLDLNTMTLSTLLSMTQPGGARAHSR